MPLGSRVVVLDREAGRSCVGQQRHRLGDAAGIVRVAPLAVDVERQVRRRRELGDVRDELVAGDGLVVLAERPGEAGARRRERLEAAASARSRAEPTSHGFGITKSRSAACSSLNARRGARRLSSCAQRPERARACRSPAPAARARRGRARRGGRAAAAATPQILVRRLAEPALGAEAERVVRGARLRAGAEQDVADDERAVLRQPVDDLRRARASGTRGSRRAARLRPTSAASTPRFWSGSLRARRRPDACLSARRSPGRASRR